MTRTSVPGLKYKSAISLSGSIALFVLVVSILNGCAPSVELIESNVEGTAFSGVSIGLYEDINRISATVRSILDKHKGALKEFLLRNDFYCELSSCRKIFVNHVINHNSYKSTDIVISVLVQVVINKSDAGYDLIITHVNK